MDFASEFRLMAIKRVLMFVVGVTAAFVLRSYWALVIGMAAGRISGVALSYWMQPFRPRLSLACARELFRFSGWLLVNNVAGVLLSKVPHFVIGRFFGAQALGAYSVGAEIAQLPSTELVAPINRAMFPGYSRLASDPAAFRRVCVDATAVILLFVLPLSVGIAMLAEPFVGILLGSQWTDAVPVIQILAFAGAVGAITSNNISAYIALGRPHLTTVILITRVVLLALTIFVLAGSKGLVGVAIAEFVAAAGSLAVSVPVLLSTLKISTGDYVAGLWRPLLASAGMGLAVHAASSALAAGPQIGALVVQLGASALLGAVTYPLMIGALWWLSGRPSSAEAQVARHLYGALRHALAR
jgi:PST family polysaccharide transporter